MFFSCALFAKTLLINILLVLKKSAVSAGSSVIFVARFMAFYLSLVRCLNNRCYALFHALFIYYQFVMLFSRL